MAALSVPGQVAGLGWVPQGGANWALDVVLNEANGRLKEKCDRKKRQALGLLFP